MKIGLIDSGIGGLTILKTLMEKHPNHEYIYYGDTIHMPFGDKTKEEVIEYGNNIIKFLESKDVELIVLACGTLSSNVELLHSNIRIIDLLSPLNNKLDHYNTVSIMATPISIKTNAFKKYIHTNLDLIACPNLANLIEHKDYEQIDEDLQRYLNNKESDVLVLGCTHYPIVMDLIKKYYKKEIICLDKCVSELIPDNASSQSSLKLYFSYLDEDIIKNIKEILNLKDIHIERKCL